jgi:N-acetylglucosamine-6-phosphate deacetylase
VIVEREYALSGNLVLGDEVVPGIVVVKDGLIDAVLRGHEAIHDLPVYEAPYIAPGYIDIQVNGGFGVDVDGDPSTYRVLGERLPRHGVTSYLPTAVSAPAGFYRPLIENYVNAGVERLPGAHSLGFHLEGPFLSPARKGAHRREVLEAATVDTVLDAVKVADCVRLVTLAPERRGGTFLIEQLRELGVAVSLGHTDATYEEFEHGVDAGAWLATHLYNAMRPFGHREPGPIGAALTDDRISASIIADGHHVDRAALELAVRAKGVDRLILISDLVKVSGMPPGTYDQFGQEVISDGQTARLRDGTLAGVIATLDECVCNVIDWGLVTLLQAVRMASENPARLLGLTHKGGLTPGFDADIVLLDERHRVQATYVRGVPAYSAKEPL